MKTVSILTKAFWSKNRIKIAISCLLPVSLSFMENMHMQIFVLTYMYIIFPAFLFSKYSEKLIVKKNICVLGNKAYSTKDFIKSMFNVIVLFIISVVVGILLCNLNLFFKILSTSSFYIAWHLYCFLRDEPLEILRETIKNIKFYPLHYGYKKIDYTYDSDRYGPGGVGPKANLWKQDNDML